MIEFEYSYNVTGLDEFNKLEHAVHELTEHMWSPLNHLKLSLHACFRGHVVNVTIRAPGKDLFTQPGNLRFTGVTVYAHGERAPVLSLLIKGQRYSVTVNV